jgi:hemerythrin
MPLIQGFEERFLLGVEAMMAESGFPAAAEHQADHARVLGDLQRLHDRVARDRSTLARAYVREQLPGWFELHAKTMDAALAAEPPRLGAEAEPRHQRVWWLAGVRRSKR